MRTVRSRVGFVLATLLATAVHAATIDAAFPGFGGPPGHEPPSCAASALSGDTLFLAGSLRWAGPLTGGGVPVRASDLGTLPGFPRVNGSVLAATPDGAGGWFIGGAFTHVGGLPHANLAHVLADLSVDSWAPATNSDVITLLATPTDVWFGGTFTSVDDSPASGFAAVSRETGSVVAAPAVNGLVAALASDDSQLYVGGEFTSVNGAPRSRLAALRLEDLALSAWDPAANADVYALASANGVVYAGGNFTSVQGVNRSGAAALDPATGVPTAWDPRMGIFNGYGVRALLPVADRVYLGGGFIQMGGESRLGLAAVDTATGAVTSWDAHIRTVTAGIAPPIVTGLAMAGGDLLAGGEFEQVGGIPRSDLVRLDTTTARPVLPAPEAPAEARALATSDGNVFVGGRFSTFGAERRADLLAVRASTGELLPWAPAATRDQVVSLFGNPFFHPSNVVAIAVDSARVYAALSYYDAFTGSDRQSVHAFARATGAMLWTVEPQGSVNALAVVDSVLFVGGAFVAPANGLLALAAASGTAQDWGGATSGGAVQALCMTPAGLAVGGTFTSAGGEPRANLALLDRATGIATDWAPGADGPVWALALAGSTLYCGGDFTACGGEPRARLAALSLDDGSARAWDPGANAVVRALGVGGAPGVPGAPAEGGSGGSAGSGGAGSGIVFAGGAFTTAGGEARTCVAALHPGTGAALPWDGAVGLGHSVLALAVAGDHVFAGGTQVTAGAEPARGFTAFAAPEPLADVAASARRAERGTLRVEPQPARAVAQVRLKLPHETDAEIGLYDLTGRKLAILEPWGHRPAGEVTISLEARQLQPGIYLVRAITPEGDIAGKLVVLP